MQKLIISLNGSTESEIENQGSIQQVSWNALLPYIENFVRLRPEWEVVQGLIVSDTDILVSIGRKRGRKKEVRFSKKDKEFIENQS